MVDEVSWMWAERLNEDDDGCSPREVYVKIM